MDNRRERAIGLRALTSFPLLLCEGQHAAHCRAREISASGIVVERGRELNERELRATLRLELFLPGGSRPVRALAKVARRLQDTCYALRFVMIADVDRLSLMELVDQQRAGSLSWLDHVSAA